MQKEFKKFEDKAASAIGSFAGRLSFVYVNVLFFTIWILLNTGFFGDKYIFDPFPFIFLTFVVSLEAIFLATFVLIVQSRESRVSERRARLDYATNVKAEIENKIMLKVLTKLAKKLGVDFTEFHQEMEELEQKHGHIKSEE